MSTSNYISEPTCRWPQWIERNFPFFIPYNIILMWLLELQVLFLFLFLKIPVNGQQGMPVSSFRQDKSNHYIEYKGMPYLVYGIQLRIDDYLGYRPYTDSIKLAGMHEYFEYTAKAGFRDAAIPVPWYWIETGENQFNFSLIDTFLYNANKYNLRLHILWFGSDVCGSSCAPLYINNQLGIYPRIVDKAGAPFVFNNSKLIAEEVNALDRLADYLSKKDANRRVLMIQIENEPNGKGVTGRAWAGGQKKDVLHLLDTLGKVIHNSQSNMITRVNLTTSDKSADEFQYLSGINMVGSDCYAEKLTDFITISGYFNYPWNFNYTPENGATYSNGINLALAAFDQGAGYLMYELRTTGTRVDSYDFGLFRSTRKNDWIERDGSRAVTYLPGSSIRNTEIIAEKLRNFNEMIYKADKKIAECPDQRSIAFNLINSKGKINESKKLSAYMINFYSPNGGLALVLEDKNKDLILLNLKDSSVFTFDEIPLGSHTSVGWFDEHNAWHKSKSLIMTNKTLRLESKEVALISKYN